MSRRVHARRRVCGLPARRFFCERLEGRVLLSGVMWTGAGDGVNWTDARNWSSNPALPGPADDVVVPASAGTIHLASGNQSVHTILGSEALSLDGGSLNVVQQANWFTSVTLNGGTLKGGLWTLKPGFSMIATSADNTLDDVSLTGTLDLSTQVDAQVTVLEGLRVTGNVLIGNASGTTFGRLIFGTESTRASGFAGHATVLFGRSTNNAIIDQSNLAGEDDMFALSVDMIHGINGTISGTFPNAILQNGSEIASDGGGTINVNFSSAGGGTFAAGGGTLLVSGLTGSIGTVEFLPTASDNSIVSLDGHYAISGHPLMVPSGATLKLNGSWSTFLGEGPSVMVSGGRLQLGGVFSLQPGEIVQTLPNPPSGEPNVTITGTLNGDLALNASTGSWRLSGTIVGGTVNESDGATLVVNGEGGTLNGVTVNGPLNVIAGQLTILNGLVLNGTMQVGRTTDGLIDYGYVYFGNQTTPAGSITGTGTVDFGGNSLDSFHNLSGLPGPGNALTIGPNITVHGVGTIACGLGLLNQGTIQANVSVGALELTGPVTNDGTLSAANGGVLSLHDSVTDNGTMSFQSGGSLIGTAALTINSRRFTFSNNATPVQNTLGSLTINGSGVLDLANNVLTITGLPSHPPDALLRGYLHSGYDDGQWDGPGIISSSADTNHALALVDSDDGVVPNLPIHSVRIELARVGDLNLDGEVDSADLLILAQHYGQANANWDQGDLNYDGTVGFDDLMLLARNFGQGTAGLDASILRRRGHVTWAPGARFEAVIA